MQRLIIVPEDSSPQSRRKLLEKITSHVLTYYGYRMERILGVSDTGKDMDIEGKHTASNVPFYAECKCSETLVSAFEIQAFYGKYMVQWHKNNTSHGLLLALSGLDQAAESFYQRYVEANLEVAVRLYVENEILKAVIDTPKVADPDTIAGRISPKIGKPGDWLLLYTDRGEFWVQHVIRPDKKNLPCVALFDAIGNPISDRPTLDYLTKLYPKINDYNNITVGGTIALQAGLFQDTEEIGKLSASSKFFEHQFPVSPEHFIGRQSYLNQIDAFVKNVVEKETSSRSVVLEAPPGFGKSSLVLASTARLITQGHFALALDVRNVSSSRFMLRTINHIRRQFGDFGGHISQVDFPKPFTELEAAINTIIEIGRTLERHAKLVIVFFDQFENVFFQTDILEHLKNVHLKISNAQTNVALVFSYNSEAADTTDIFDYELLKPITDLSDHVVLDIFSKNEINEILDKLEEKLGKPLRKGLRFHLAEFSHGCPWLLKKLCVETIGLHRNGMPQADIPQRFLNIETLFKRDNYLLMANTEDVIKAIRILEKANGCLETSKLRAQAKLSAKSFFYAVRDMSLLKVAHVDHDDIILQIKLPGNPKEFEVSWRNHLQSKLQRNHLVRKILIILNVQNTLKMEELSQRLENLCPYLTASEQAWLTYARAFAKWLNSADLALLDSKNTVLAYFDSETQIREQQLVLPKRHGAKTPQIQFSPVENIAIKLWQALQKDGRVDWTGQKKSTIYRALATLEDFGFIQRRHQLIKVLPKCFEFASNPEQRPELFAQSALKLEAFKKFIKILKSHKNKGNTLLALGLELRDTLGASWKESTAEKIAKILLDWARHTKLAPGVFARTRRGPLKGWKKKEDMQIPLF